MKQLVPAVQDLKRRSLHQPGGETIMPVTLIALREDRVVTVVTAPRMNVVLSVAPTLAIGLNPQMLVLAAQANLPANEETGQEAGEAIAYTTFNRAKEANLAVQRYRVQGDEVVFTAPERGRPDDRTIMDELAKAMTHEPLDPGRVARKDEVATGPDGQQTPQSFIPEAEGRVALDAGTVKAVHDKIRAIGGSALFIAADGVNATKLLASGLPQDCLLSGS